jgi:hypothetical protein
MAPGKEEGYMSAGGAAAAAAAVKRRQEQEEEEATFMNTDPSGVFEYKIIRSATNAFRNPAFFQQTLQEEARAGWELVEKLDNGRVRLRRSIEWRSKDGQLEQDPYRSQVGMSEVKLAVTIMACIFGTIFIAILLVFLLTR